MPNVPTYDIWHKNEYFQTGQMMSNRGIECDENDPKIQNKTDTVDILM